MNEQFIRTIGLIGEDNFKIIQQKVIAVIGLGGVGGTALEALARTGFKKFIISDFDTVSSSNLNRQILYTQKDVNRKKVEAAKERILSINPDVEMTVIDKKIDKDSVNEFIKADFIIDAIDDVPAKIAISQFATINNIPMILSLGMAKKMDPTKVEVIRLDKTTNDPLAKKVRYEIKKAGLDTKKLYAVCSKEIKTSDGPNLNSIMMVPSAAGLAIASYTLNYFINKGE